jgi:hypothetical protein
MVPVADLRATVEEAERAWSDGDWLGAFQRFQKLSLALAADRDEAGAFDPNGSIVVHRYADIAAQTGRIRIALDAYGMLQQHGGDAATRALAAFKRLDLATSSGDGRLATEVFAGLNDVVWSQPPPATGDSEGVCRWEQTMPWPADERPTILAHMYLALGRFYNSIRQLDASSRWLHRGLHHATQSRGSVGRMTAIPTLLALANNQLTCGDTITCRATLATAASTASAEPFGAVYLLWQRLAEARLALVEGRFADVLSTLAAAETLARSRRQVRAICQCLLSRAQMFVVMNLLPEADQCLDRAGALLSDAPDLRPAADRVRFLRTSRERVFSTLKVGDSAGEMMASSADAPQIDASPQNTIALDDAAVVWTGDCLSDYEIREVAVYAQIDKAPEEAAAELQDLWRDFGHVGSMLLVARLQVLTGLVLLRSGDSASAADALATACETLREIRAEHELYHATLFLARAYRDLNSTRFEALLIENDQRLSRLVAGLGIEERNAFITNKYTTVQEHQRLRIQRLIELKAGVHSQAPWRRLLSRLKYWYALHEFICDLDDQQAGRQQVNSGLALLEKGYRGLLRRLLLHPWNNLTVGYIVLPDQTFMYQLRWGWMDCRMTEIGRLTVELLHRSLVGSRIGDYDTTAGQVCEALGLQEAIARAPRRVRSLTIVEDAALHLVPFCALRYIDHGRRLYLIERVAVNVDTLSTTRRRVRAGNGRAVVACYDGTARPLLRARPAADNAADRLRRSWNMTALQVERRAACLAALPEAEVFYYFGHGYFQPGAPELSGIEFEGGDGNEILSIDDVDGLRFADMQQAVVLACHSADAVPYTGRWVVGLPQMLLRRGARSVLAAMWETDPAVAEQVSNQFIGLAAKLGRAEALRQAQLRVLGSGPTADPFWWAAFRVYGDGRRPSVRHRARWR